jgi:hypothetical protein
MKFFFKNANEDGFVKTETCDQETDVLWLCSDEMKPFY